MSETVAFTATGEEAGSRLDAVLARRTTRSRAEISALIRSGMIRIDGHPAKPSHHLKAGERVEAALPQRAPRVPVAEEIPIAIVFEDEDISVVDKPAGMATHPAPGSPSRTLVNALLARLGPLPALGDAARPGIVHRLDKDTSGLLVVAKSERAMRALAAAIAAHHVEREYDAVVWGAPPAASGAIDAPLARDPTARTRFAVRHEGKHAITHYRTVETYDLRSSQLDRDTKRGSPKFGRYDQAALLRVTLETGRTHQIRVHFAAIGHPIAGDPIYGAGYPDLGIGRQALHAARLRFVHPVTGAPLTFDAPRPADFEALIERLQRGAAG